MKQVCVCCLRLNQFSIAFIIGFFVLLFIFIGHIFCYFYEQNLSVLYQIVIERSVHFLLFYVIYFIWIVALTFWDVSGCTEYNMVRNNVLQNTDVSFNVHEHNIKTSPIVGSEVTD